MLAFSMPTPARFALVFLTVLSLVGCGRRIGEEQDQGTAAVSTAPTPGASTAPTATAAATAPRGAGESWNAGQIAWQPYDTGLVLAKTQKKPVCLVFSTTWCPHCKNFSHVFDDPRVVAHARDFVMIHLDADAEEAIASKYALDGSYIPRTFFLAPDGKVDDTIHAPRNRSRYFYDERDPSDLLAAMDTAKQRLVN
jgi:thiol:disulfide interchange protein